jgi:hypothetical protein
MGWRDSHLHEFAEGVPPVLEGKRTPLRWGAPSPDDSDILNEEGWTIAGALEELPLSYTYDLGDGWEHIVEIHPDIPAMPDGPPVLLVAGENRAPWEDSGGIPGYTEKRAILDDPRHPEHRLIAQWVAETVGPWTPSDPGFFDRMGVQSELNLLFNPAGSGAHPGDMSGLVKADEIRSPGDLDLASPLVAFVAALPVPIRAELRQHLHRTGVLAPIDIDEGTTERIIRPFTWLIAALGEDGLALTSAGWLPPAVVLDGMTTLGWLDEWIGKGNREDLTPPIASLREVAQRMGLVRVQKGRLLLGAAAKKALGDPLALLRLVARSLYRKLGDAEADAAVLLLLSLADGTPPAERWRAIAFGLEMAGWQARSGGFLKEDIRHTVWSAEQVLGILFGWRFRMDGEVSEDVVLFAREGLR